MFRFKDIEKLVKLSGFEFRNSTGSHHIYLHKQSGITVSVPKHPEGVSVGVGEKVIRACVLCARISNINIGKAKLTNEIHEIILNHHKRCRENILFLIPDEYREINEIKTGEDVHKYLKRIKQNYNTYNNKNYKNNKELAT